jgi:hypothetical protein
VRWRVRTNHHVTIWLHYTWLLFLSVFRRPVDARQVRTYRVRSRKQLGYRYVLWPRQTARTNIGWGPHHPLCGGRVQTWHTCHLAMSLRHEYKSIHDWKRHTGKKVLEKMLVYNIYIRARILYKFLRHVACVASSVQYATPTKGVGTSHTSNSHLSPPLHPSASSFSSHKLRYSILF